MPCGILTNVSYLVINTNRRTYHLELRATPATYMASVSWSYPEQELIALRAAEIERERIAPVAARSEEHTSELQSLMRISYAVFCLKKKINTHIYIHTQHHSQT